MAQPSWLRAGRQFPTFLLVFLALPLYRAAARADSATRRLTMVSITASARPWSSSLGSGTIGCGTVTTSYDGMPRLVHCKRAA